MSGENKVPVSQEVQEEVLSAATTLLFATLALQKFSIEWRELARAEVRDALLDLGCDAGAAEARLVGLDRYVQSLLESDRNKELWAKVWRHAANFPDATVRFEMNTYLGEVFRELADARRRAQGARAWPMENPPIALEELN